LAPASCESLELDFDVRSSGSYDPGCWTLPNGDPGYPPSGGDDREVKGVSLLLDGKTLREPSGTAVWLSQASADLLAALYEDKIQAAELPEQERD
jgi:hypothetical protein